MQLYRIIAAATAIAFLPNLSFAVPTQIDVSPSAAQRQPDGSYVLGDMMLAEGQWYIQEAPTGPYSCCKGYRFVSNKNSQLASLTLLDKQHRFTTFEAEVQYNDTLFGINNIWGWINAYSSDELISSTYFGGHYWSQLGERQTISALIPSFADRIEIKPRTNIGYTTFSYSITAVPEPATVSLLGVACVGIIARSRFKFKKSCVGC